jgi:hypothetical protein
MQPFQCVDLQHIQRALILKSLVLLLCSLEQQLRTWWVFLNPAPARLFTPRHWYVQGASTILGDVGSYPGASVDLAGAALYGVNHGSDSVSAAAQARLRIVYPDLYSRTSTPIIAELSSTTVLSGVYSCSDYFTLSAGGIFGLDAQVSKSW